MNFYAFLCLKETAVFLGNSRSGAASISLPGGSDPKGISVADPCFNFGQKPTEASKVLKETLGHKLALSGEIFLQYPRRRKVAFTVQLAADLADPIARAQGRAASKRNHG